MGKRDAQDFIQQKVYLTPKLLQKLEAISRAEAGCPLVVYERTLKKPWGCVDFRATSFHNVPLSDMLKKGYHFLKVEGKTHINTDLNCIEISNFILRTGEPCQRALDWGAIPNNKIYEFLVWHEVAHVVHRDVPFRLHFGPLGRHRGELPEGIEPSIVRGQEIRADRWAWNKLFPDIKMPGTKVMSKKEVNSYLSVLEKFEQKYDHKPSTPIGISLLSNEYIYFKYEKEGIPWAGPAKRLARHQAGAA